MKWICKSCQAINAQFSFNCHNCGKPAPTESLGWMDFPTEIVDRDGDKWKLDAAYPGIAIFMYVKIDDPETFKSVTSIELHRDFTFEIPKPKAEIVRQGKYECAAASLAQLMKKPLFFVKRAMGKHHWRNDNRGASHEHMRLAAREFGHDLICVGSHGIGLLKGDLPNASISIESLNYPKMNHAVTWVDGEILDPNFGHPTRKYWGPKWTPQLMGAKWAEILTRRPLSDSEHAHFKHLRKEGTGKQIRETVLELAA